jgi:hypothetical protein
MLHEKDADGLTAEDTARTILRLYRARKFNEIKSNFYWNSLWDDESYRVGWMMN